MWEDFVLKESSLLEDSILEGFTSRKDKLDAEIQQFFRNLSQTSTVLILYTSEIPYLERKYHIKITKGKHYQNDNNLPLFSCTAEKLY